MVKMTKLSLSMAIRAHLRVVTLGFSMILVLCASAHSAAEPLLVAEISGSPTAAVPSSDVQPPLGGEPSVSDFGSKTEAPALAEIDAELPDAWAEAFSAGSRVPYRPAIVEAPSYPVADNSQV